MQIQGVLNRVIFVLAFATISLTVYAQEAPPADPVVNVGGESVVVPLPADFVRIDGILPDYDDIIRGFLPPTNKLLINFGTPKERAWLRDIESGKEPEMTRSYNVQVLKQFIRMNVSVADFKEMIKQTKKEVAGLDMNKVLSKVAEKGNQKMRDVTGEQGDISFTSAAVLGVLEEGENFLSFGMEVNVGGDGEMQKSYSVVSVVRVHGKVLYLYATAPSTAADRDWAKSGMVYWRNDLLAKNSALAATMATKPTSNISGLGNQKGLLGTIVPVGVALAVALLVINWIKNRKSRA